MKTVLIILEKFTMALIFYIQLGIFVLIFNPGPCWSFSTIQYIDHIVSDIVPQCYFIQIHQTESKSSDLNLDFRNNVVPGIKLDVRSFDFQLMKCLGTNQVIRYHQQCITFIVPYRESTMENHYISKFFSSPELQPQAGISYLIFHPLQLQQSKTDFKLLDVKLTSEAFKNFPRRILLSQKLNDESVKVYKYCYYCLQGKGGFIRSEQKQFGLLEAENGRDADTENTVFPDVTRNLDGHALIFTAPPAPPLVYIVASKKNPAKLEIVGMQEVILKSLASTLNFTYILRRATGGLTGVRLPNGGWNGIMDEILSGKADIGLSVATSYERNKFFEFTVPVFNAFLVLVSRKPSPFFNWEAIFYPFRRNAWLAILACTVLSLLVYRILHNKTVQVENIERARRTKSKGLPVKSMGEVESKISYFQATYFTVGALLEQGYQLRVVGIPPRAFVSFWFFVAIVITCAYRSKLFLFLTFPIVEKPPSTFQELSVSKYKWGLKSLGGVGLLFITQSPLPSVRYIGEKLEISTDKYSCLDRTLNEKFVCVIYRAYIDYMLELRYWNMKHKFYISDYLTPPVGSSWVLRKYSPLLPILDKFHAGQFEMGLADKYIDIYQQHVAKDFRTMARDPNSKVDKFEQNINYIAETEDSKPLRLLNLYGPFFILAFGLGLASIILATEILLNGAAARKQSEIEPFRKPNTKPLFQRSVLSFRRFGSGVIWPKAR